MRLREIHLTGFKRFTETRIHGLSAEARLIVLAGPNGSGKSSLFDGLKTWHWLNGGIGAAWDESYGAKAGSVPMSWPEHVKVEFHEPLPVGEELKKLVYVRSAFRNEADFNMTSLNRVASPLDQPKVQRLIDNDMSVSDNFQRLILASVDGLYGSDIPDSITKGELRDRLIGKVRLAMQEVFPSLVLDGVGGIFSTDQTVGTFYFSKGTSQRFLYKNLSAGEKATFDLLLDAVIKGDFFDNSVWCIDEPEAHLNTRVQGSLLRALMRLVPEHSQLILASHSIGFMSEAWKMAKEMPGSVEFLDLQGVDFDQPQVVAPVKPSRDFWSRTLDVALGDLAQLVAPEHIVLCEGRPSSGDGDSKAEFDASCYRIIFAAEFPNVDFLSVGNSDEVTNDRLGAGKAIQAVNAGTRLTRLIDLDMRNQEEVDGLRDAGVRVLSRRNIEAFLLDDEVLTALCVAAEQPGRAVELVSARDAAMEASVKRGNDPDDYKKVASQVYFDARKLLSLTQSGSDWAAFARSTLAPLIHEGMQSYADLKRDLFDQ